MSDNGELNGRSLFWTDVAEEYGTNIEDYNGLYVTDDPNYTGIDPSVIVEHDSAALYEIWKDLSSAYGEADRKSRQSGHHEPFMAYCDGRVDVAYAEVCVAFKPLLGPFVRGAMLETSKMDSTNPSTLIRPKKRHQENQNNQTPVDSNGFNDTLREIGSFFKRRAQAEVAPTPASQRDPLTVLQCISTSYTFLGQLKDSLQRLRQQGISDPMLESSIALQEAAIRSLEREYATLLGLGSAAPGDASVLHIAL